MNAHSVFPFPSSLHPKLADAVFRFVNAESAYDPFAGSAVVPVEAWLRGVDGAGYDILPVAPLYAYAKRSMLLGEGIEETEEALKSCEPTDCGIAERIAYWFDPRLLPYACCLAKLVREHGAWRGGGCVGIRNPLLALTSLHLIKRISYADDSLLKWFRSRKKMEVLAGVLGSKGAEWFVKREAERVLARISSVPHLKAEPDARLEVRGCVDSTEEHARAELVFTSPPYLTAWEYVRCFKVELAVLGFSDEEIRGFARRELRARTQPAEAPCSGVEAVCRKASGGSPKAYARCTSFFALASKAVFTPDASYAALVTGTPRLGGTPVAMHEAFDCLASANGFTLVHRFADRIRKKRFGKRMKNPGMREEVVSIYARQRA